MTLRQRKFIDGVLAGLAPGEAAKEAGYKGHDAQRALMANAEVKAAIHLARQGSAVTRENVLKELGRIGFAGAGEKTSDRLRALEVLCRVLGLYERGAGEQTEKVVIVEDLGKD